MINLFVAVLFLAFAAVVALGWIDFVRRTVRLFSRKRELRASDLRGEGAAPFWGSPGEVFHGIGAAYRDDPLDAPIAPIAVSQADFDAYRKATDGVENLIPTMVPCGGMTGAEFAKAGKVGAWAQVRSELVEDNARAADRIRTAAAGAAMAHDDRDWRGTGQARKDSETVIEASWDGKRFTKGMIA